MDAVEVVAAPPDQRALALELFCSERPIRLARVLRATRPRAWSRALDENPARSGEAAPRLWLAFQAGRPCGVLLGVPLVATLGALRQAGHWGVDLYVPPSLRGRGIAVQLLTRWRDESPLALGLGITDSAHRIELGLGWTAGSGPHWMVRPLTKCGALFNFSRVCVRAIASARGAADSAQQMTFQKHLELLRNRRSLGFTPMHRCSPLPPISQRSAEFHVRALSRRECLIWLEAHPPALAHSWPGNEIYAHLTRDSAWFEWRYSASGVAEWSFTLAECGDDASILLISRSERRVWGKNMWWYELFVSTGPSLDTPDLRLVTALDALLEHQRLLGVDRVEGRFSAPLHPLLSAVGFSPRETCAERFIVHPGEHLDPLVRQRWRDAPWLLDLSDSGNLNP